MIQEMLRSTMERYHYTHGQPPKRMRASRHLGARLWKELEDSGVVIHDPAWAAKHPMESGEFEYRGCRVKCDLPAEPLTVLAEAPDYANQWNWP